MAIVDCEGCVSLTNVTDFMLIHM